MCLRAITSSAGNVKVEKASSCDFGGFIQSSQIYPLPLWNSLCFLGAVGLSVPGLSRPTFSSERRSILRRELTKKQEASCRRALTKLEDESDHTMDSLACGSPSKAKPEAREAVKVTNEACAQGRVGQWGQGCNRVGSPRHHSKPRRELALGAWAMQLAKMSTASLCLVLTLYIFYVSKKASPPKNKSWMNHLRVPQRELERLLLARMEGRNHFLKNPRFFPPNTPHGGRSLLFPLKKPGLMGEVQKGELGQRCVLP